MSAVVLLLSGGLDSTTIAYLLKTGGRRFHALGVDYGQAHVAELDYARRTCAILDVPFHVATVDPIPGVGEANVYPARNGVLISLAAVRALQLGFTTLTIGCNADDEEDYVDCRAGYLNAWNDVLAFQGLRLEHPFSKMTKGQVVAFAEALNVPLDDTRSCYLGGDVACHQCAACRLRERSCA